MWVNTAVAVRSIPEIAQQLGKRPARGSTPSPPRFGARRGDASKPRKEASSQTRWRNAAERASSQTKKRNTVNTFTEWSANYWQKSIFGYLALLQQDLNNFIDTDVLIRNRYHTISNIMQCTVWSDYRIGNIYWLPCMYFCSIHMQRDGRTNQYSAVRCTYFSS